MIIGCMGKGGSGKSTIATSLVKTAHANGRATLAIDADHNMDLQFNLAGAQANVPYLGERREELLNEFSVKAGERFYARALREPSRTIRLEEGEVVLKKFAHSLGPRLWLMAAGPHTDEVHSGRVCSHVLASGLKLILPFLGPTESEVVIVDSTAGMDMVGSGIAAAMDAVCIVVEPTIYGAKTALQIAEGLERYGTPGIFIANKLQSPEQMDQMTDWLGAVPMFAYALGSNASAESATSQDVLAYLGGMRSVEERRADRIQRLQQAVERLARVDD